MKERNRFCKFCGKEFYAFTLRKEFCSRACASKDFFKKNPNYERELRRVGKNVYKRKCLNCGLEFETTDSRKKYCRSRCKEQFNNKNRPNTKRELRTCPVCKKKFQPMQKAGVGRTYCNAKCRNKAMNERRYALTKSKGFKGRRKSKWAGNWWKALERDNFTCQICGEKKLPGLTTNKKRFQLEVHHLLGNRETHNLSTLLTLCVSCHKIMHDIKLIKTGNEWSVSGKIFEILGLKGSIKIN